jgi:hypothetical protein
VGHVVTLLALLLDAAPLHVLDQRAGDADALDQGLHQVGRQVIGPDVAKDALLRMSPADRRADGLDYHGATHERSFLGWRGESWEATLPL